MPCACDRCSQNAATLGVGRGSLNKAAVRKAFRAAARTWHPDRFENDGPKRLEAEETFKRMQVAYRELWEHIEAPVIITPEGEAVREAWPARDKAPEPQRPPIFFGGIPGCYTAPHLPGYLAEPLIRLMHEGERPYGVVELSRRNPLKGVPSEYVLFTSFRIVVRSELNLLSMLWYTDLSEVKLVDRRQQGKWNKFRRIVRELSGIKNKETLEIYRREGQLFYAIRESADDSMKKVVYNFLRQMKE